MPDPTDPSAILAGIREQLDGLVSLKLNRHLRMTEEQVNSALDAIYEAALRPVAAVEAVLKRHQPHVRRRNWPEVCHYDNRRWPCPEVQDITAALTGEEAGEHD